MTIQAGPTKEASSGKTEENQIAKLLENGNYSNRNESYKACIKLCANGYQMTKEDLIALGNKSDLFMLTTLNEVEKELTILLIQHYHQYVERHKEYPDLYFPEVMFGKTELESFVSSFKAGLTVAEINNFKKGIQIARQNLILSHSFEEKGYLGWHPRGVRRAFKKIFKQLAAEDLDDTFKSISDLKLKENVHKLFTAFSKNFKSRNIKNLGYYKEKLKLGEPLPFMLAGNGHGTGTVIYKNHMVYVNTGRRGTCNQFNESGLWIFKIAEDKKELLLEKIIENDLRDVIAIETFIDNFTKDKWLHKQYFQPIETQKMGNCSWRAFKFLLPATLSLDFLPEIKKRKKSLLQRVVPFILDKAIGAFSMGKSLFTTIREDDDHSVWYIRNVLKSDHLDFMRSYHEASSLFEKYYEIYLASEISHILDSSSVEQPIVLNCDEELLVRCYKNLQQRQTSQPIIEKLGLDKKMTKLVSLSTRPSLT